APSPGDSARGAAAKTGQDADGEEPPEPLIGGQLDLGGIATEFLLLGIDPYPRKAGAEFMVRKADDAGARPFAALESLKKRLGGGQPEARAKGAREWPSGLFAANEPLRSPRRVDFCRRPNQGRLGRSMPDKVRIALDAMGGDHGAVVLLPGADLSLSRHPDIEYLLFGNTALVEPVLNGLPRLKARSRLTHTEVAIHMDDKASQALRHGRWKSSMWLAIDAVKKGDADVAVSAGNTGALMAMARFNLKMMEGIERPAIAALWPTLKGESVVLDVGASIGADEAHLVNLAAMGSAMARVLFDIERPTVGLLNIGVE